MPSLCVQPCTRRPVSSLFDLEPLFSFDLISSLLKKQSNWWSAGTKLQTKQQQKGCPVSLFVARVAVDNNFCAEDAFGLCSLRGWRLLCCDSLNMRCWKSSNCCRCVPLSTFACPRLFAVCQSANELSSPSSSACHSFVYKQGLKRVINWSFFSCLCSAFND